MLRVTPWDWVIYKGVMILFPSLTINYCLRVFIYGQSLVILLSTSASQVSLSLCRSCLDNLSFEILWVQFPWHILKSLSSSWSPGSVAFSNLSSYFTMFPETQIWGLCYRFIIDIGDSMVSWSMYSDELCLTVMVLHDAEKKLLW